MWKNPQHAFLRRGSKIICPNFGACQKSQLLRLIAGCWLNSFQFPSLANRGLSRQWVRSASGDDGRKLFQHVGHRGPVYTGLGAMNPCDNLHGPGADSASNTNEYQVYFLGLKAAGASGWQPHRHPVPLSWNLGTLTSWNPLGHSRPVTGLLYFIYIFLMVYIYIYIP
jgi:hypothetical protein